MELKSLILGLVFSLGVFALKSGAGLAYLLSDQISRKQRLSRLAGFVGVYAAVFAGSWFLVCRSGFLFNLDNVSRLLESGMTLHFILAFLLLLWGVILLQQEPAGPEVKSRAWLLLVIPCPLCFSVIVLSGAFLHNLMPRVSYLFFWLASGFISLSLIWSGVLLRFGSDHPEHDLGAVMLLAALYFLVTIAVVPQFAGIESIYRLSRSRTTSLSLSQLLQLGTVLLLFFGIGFIRESRRSLCR